MRTPAAFNQDFLSTGVPLYIYSSNETLIDRFMVSLLDDAGILGSHVLELAGYCPRATAYLQPAWPNHHWGNDDPLPRRGEKAGQSAHFHFKDASKNLQITCMIRSEQGHKSVSSAQSTTQIETFRLPLFVV
jgi:hypothetical protein